MINYELPHVPEDYVHRIGRTGRNGSSGEALSLVSQEDAKYLRQIVRLLDRDMEIRDLPGFEPQVPIRWGNSAPGKAEQPGGERPPRKAGPHAGGRRDGHGAPRTAAGNAPRPRQPQGARDGRPQARPAGGRGPGQRPAQPRAERSAPRRAGDR